MFLAAIILLFLLFIQCLQQLIIVLKNRGYKKFFSWNVVNLAE